MSDMSISDLDYQLLLRYICELFTYSHFLMSEMLNVVVNEDRVANNSLTLVTLSSFSARKKEKSQPLSSLYKDNPNVHATSP